MREYLDLEFKEIEPVLPFDYSLERIIDDFVLLAVFIGNDFLPHLPDVHIHGDGLERLFEIYKQVLPSLGTSTCNLWVIQDLPDYCPDGYLNDSGTINTTRLQVLLDRMRDWELEIFQHQYEYSDIDLIKKSASEQPENSQDISPEIGWSNFRPFLPLLIHLPSDDVVAERNLQSSQGVRGEKPSDIPVRTTGRGVVLVKCVFTWGTNVPRESCSRSPPYCLLGRV